MCPGQSRGKAGLYLYVNDRSRDVAAVGLSGLAGRKERDEEVF